MHEPELNSTTETNERVTENKGKKPLIFLFVVLGLFLVGAFIFIEFFVENPLDPDASIWDGNTYTNTVLNITFDKPDDWIKMEESALQAADEEAGKIIEAEGGLYTKTLMSSYNPNINSSVNLSAFHSKVLVSDTIEESISVFEESFSNVAAYTITRMEAQTVANVPWETILIDFPDDNAQMYFLVANYDDYFCMIYAIGPVEENPVKFLEYFRTAALNSDNTN